MGAVLPQERPEDVGGFGEVLVPRAHADALHGQGGHPAEGLDEMLQQRRAGGGAQFAGDVTAVPGDAPQQLRRGGCWDGQGAVGAADGAGTDGHRGR